MKFLCSIALSIPFAAGMLFAQAAQPDTRAAGQADSGSAKTYTGIVLDANCADASKLTGASSATSSSKKSADDIKKEVLRSCAPTASASAFAILTEDGNFLKLDESGNSQIKSNKLNTRNTKISVTGMAEGDTLKVQSVNKI
jgi:hypothetical protein